MQRSLIRFFSFAGRLRRPAFALHLLAWLAAMLAIIVTATAAFDLTISEAGSRYWDEALPNGLLLVLLHWTIMALSAQRIRDMGFRTLPILVLLGAIDLLETWVLPELTQARLPSPLESLTPLGGTLSIAAMAWLLFWPSAAPP